MKKVYSEKIITVYQEFTSANILGVTLQHNGYQGGDAGHGGFVRVKFKNIAGTLMELNGKETDEFEITFRGDCERDTFIQALNMLVSELTNKRMLLLDIDQNRN